MPAESNEEAWRQILTGEMRGLRTFQSLWKKIPSEPRCKLCYAPFGKPGRFFIRVLGGKPSPLNRRLCTWCMGSAHKHPGGAEVEISAMFADVRGSTTLAEHLPAGEFGQLLTRFWGTAARSVDRWDGIVDKFVGDEAVALFIPGFAGKDHAARAIATARDLLMETGHGDGEPWIPVGIGVHTGVSYVGYIGEGDAVDFTAVGDTVNIAARLTSMASAGEILISDASALAADLDTSALERRTLELKGREETVDAWVQPAMSSLETTAA
ncbi:MAG TPA: adenylate/guanylate cyclase domain-containing protein [Gaiellaceae bacterium]|jgi:adenylate cyclase|nr:adenylate/guanylate cyclase domain-containing protein [Gaiellaceae bacterium]